MGEMPRKIAIFAASEGGWMWMKVSSFLMF